MSEAPPERIHSRLAASRAEADAILATAERRAAELSRAADASDRALAAARVARLAALRAEIDEHRRRIDAAFVGMAESMATAAMRLAEIARRAEFAPPTTPAGIQHTVEVRLSQTRRVVSETREVTITVPSRPDLAEGTREPE